MDTHFRSVVKALSWRFLATTITMVVAWIITDSLTIAAEIGVADTIIKLAVYYLHERLWFKIPLGKAKPPEYQI